MPVVASESPMMQKHNWSINKMDDSNPFSLREQTVGHMCLTHTQIAAIPSKDTPLTYHHGKHATENLTITNFCLILQI